MQTILREAFSRRMICKLCTIFLTIGLLLTGALSGLEKIQLLWIGAPILFLWFIDTAYTAEYRQCIESLKGSITAENLSVVSESPVKTVGRFGEALISLSIWPFYLPLVGIFVSAAFWMPVKAITPAVTAVNLVGNSPGQPYRPIPNNPMYQPSMQHPQPGLLPFAARPSMTPAYQRNGPGGLTPMATPLTRTVNPNYPKPLSPAPITAPPNASPESKKQ